MTAPRRTIPRAEPVGSLLRAPEITATIDAIYDGMATAWRQSVLPEKADELAELDARADQLIPDLVRHQAEAGLDVVTDGEIRRSTFLGSFLDAVDGMAEPTERFMTFDEDGNEFYGGYGDPLVAGKIHQVSNPLLREAEALEAASAPVSVPFKLTLPAPSYFLCQIQGAAAETEYPTRQAFVEDVVKVERQLIDEAIAAGATWIQFDFPVYPGLADERFSADMTKLLGVSWETALTQSIELDARVCEGLPDDVTVAMHICRGNLPGGLWQGSLEPVAERMFNELPHERFLVEWEDISREGDFSPLRHVPADKIIALGLVSTKTPELEADDDIVARLEAAAEHVPMEQLALCPQCGFASLAHDHLVSAEDAQWRKLELVGRVADRVWGRSWAQAFVGGRALKLRPPTVALRPTRACGSGTGSCRARARR
jgi:5-methyltetrahydropteroyltriglutamate--homocysteine methyltransferase